MKKRAILFLLTAFALPVFAVEGVGDFSLGLKIDAGDAAKDTRDLVITPWIDFSRNLNENFNLYFKAEVPVTTGPLKKTAPGVSFNEFQVKPNGSFTAGSGNLGFALNNVFVVPVYGKERIGKTGPDLKPKNWTYRIVPEIGYSADGEYGFFAAGLGADIQVYEREKTFNDPLRDLFLSLEYAGNTGILLAAKPYLDIQPEIQFGGLYAKLIYADDNFGAGIEVDKFPAKFEIAKAGFPLDIFGEAYLLSKVLTLGGHLKLRNLGNKTAGNNKVSINPGIYGIYRF